MSESPRARILVADDEANIMKALCDTLRERGYDAVGTSSGTTALAALQQSRFDLLLTDLMMPDTDGISLLKAAMKIDPDIVGIIMTGQGGIDTAVEAMKTGALDYILKPFQLSNIQPVLNRALAVRRLRLENAELERSVRQRTEELVQANRELEAFSYTVSHDLRAPLRAMNSFSDMLLEEFSSDLPQEGRELLHRIARNAQRMSQLIEDLLRFSRIGQQPLLRQPVDMTTLAHEVMDEAMREGGNPQVNVRIDPLPECHADEGLIRQVMSNLFSNALKFTRKTAAPQIEVGCFNQDGENIFFVRDNGAGFDMQHARKLFGVFQRLHSATEFEGTGIGLSIVQRVVQRHGGRVWAQAAVNEGAAFYFTIDDGESAS